MLADARQQHENLFSEKLNQFMKHEAKLQQDVQEINQAIDIQQALINDTYVELKTYEKESIFIDVNIGMPTHIVNHFNHINSYAEEG